MRGRFESVLTCSQQGFYFNGVRPSEKAKGECTLLDKEVMRRKGRPKWTAALSQSRRTNGPEESEDGAAKLAESQNLCHGGDEKSLQSEGSLSMAELVEFVCISNTNINEAPLKTGMRDHSFFESCSFSTLYSEALTQNDSHQT